MAGTILRAVEHCGGCGTCLNGVRPRWPEQCGCEGQSRGTVVVVSMESGLDGRNNLRVHDPGQAVNQRLNGVRPRWPEQSIEAYQTAIELNTSQWSPA